MAALVEDRTTIDMFALNQRGRPRCNPYPRDVQLRINKRVQRERDKAKGYRRLEVKMPTDVLERLDQLAEAANCSRQELVEQTIVRMLEMAS